MGTHPDNDDYEPGDDCAVCHASLFEGVTPKYVECDVTGIDKCIGFPIEPPDGTYLLTKIPGSCLWGLLDPPYTFSWFLGPALSLMMITVPMFEFFNKQVDDICIDAFVNGLVCGVGVAAGENGYVTLWWGPTIGP